MGIKNIEFKKIGYSDIPEEFIKGAKRGRISFLSGDHVHFWGAYEDNKLIGCTCLVIYKNGHGKIKSNYVISEYRGRGIFSGLNTLCLEFAKNSGITNITLNCLFDSVDIHLKAGAKIYKETKTIKYLVYHL